MAYLIIREKGQPDRAFPLARKSYTIGRGEKADLVLANVSVSRAHLRINREPGAGATVEDLGSQNGTYVNGKETDYSELNTGDVLEVGKFSLVFIGDEARPAMYRDQMVEDMPGYTFTRRAPEATFQMSPAVMARMREQRRLAEGAGLKDDDSDSAWLLEEDVVRFGPRGRIPVTATFARGVVAEIFWDDTQHVLRRRSRLVKCEVNGAGVSERGLRLGDKVRVGGSSFTYRMLKKI
jgi:hypothetical protein